MFDVGFMELVLIGVVALLVIGPERLPKVARTAGMWLGKGRRFISSVKSDIEQELKAEELKRILAEQAKSNPVHDIIEDIGKTTGEIKSKAESAVSDLNASAKSVTESGSEQTTNKDVKGDAEGAARNGESAKH
jgi:sec-independent protein translocase protein TatB